MSVLTIAQAQAHLNLTTAEHDVELQAMIDSSEAVLAKHCGPLTSTVITTRVKGARSTLVLPTTPALSLTSVTPVGGGAALTLTDLYLDARAGVVTYNNPNSVFSSQFYDVVYAAGRTTVPADLLMADKELVRHMWQTQRGPTRRPGSSPSESMANTLPGAAHALPFRVSELISPHIQYGFA